MRSDAAADRLPPARRQNRYSVAAAGGAFWLVGWDGMQGLYELWAVRPASPSSVVVHVECVGEESRSRPDHRSPVHGLSGM